MARKRTQTQAETPRRWWMGWIVGALALAMTVILAAGAGLEDYVDKTINSHPTIRKIAEDVAWIRGKLDSSNTLQENGS